MVSKSKTAFNKMPYAVPKTVNKLNVYCRQWKNNEKIPDLWTQIKKHGESIPSPDKYTSSRSKFGKGKFYSPKSKRVTEIDQIMKSAKKTPAPN